MLKAAIFDQDGVIVRGSPGLEMYLHEGKKLSTYLDFMDVLKKYKTKKITYDEFAELAIPLFAKGFWDYDPTDVRNIAAAVIDTMKNQIEEVRRVVLELKKHGYITILLSAGPEECTHYMATKIPFDYAQGFKIDYSKKSANGLLTPILGSAGKLRMLREIASKLGIDLSESLAVGDSVGDLGVLSAVGTPLVFFESAISSNDDELVKIAKKKGWNIIHSLTEILTYA